MSSHRRSVSFFAIILALVIGVENYPKAFGKAGDHSPQEHSGASLHLDDGKRWKTDDSLRQGMLEIKRALEPKLNVIHAGTLGSDHYVQIADEVTSSVESIFKNCKLRPDADAMLHLILAKILRGASEMKEKNKPKVQLAGAGAIAVALNQYGSYFDHPGWKPIRD